MSAEVDEHIEITPWFIFCEGSVNFIKIAKGTVFVNIPRRNVRRIHVHTHSEACCRSVRGRRDISMIH